MPTRVLVAPLNWGLGHATRCIPIIRALLNAGVEPVLASDGEALSLLRAEFPELKAIALPGYNIRYNTSNMVWNVGSKLPRLLWAFRTEQRIIGRLVQGLNIKGIISDNRYGCYNKSCSNIFLSHQLYPKIPGPFFAWAAHNMLEQAISRFDEIWVPDVAHEKNLSGELSHKINIHDNVRYIGLLSRFERYSRAQEYDLAIVLSGPEPQRTLLEERLLDQALSLPLQTIIIQGKTAQQQHFFEAEHVEVVSYMTSEKLNDILLASNAIVCRAGYSSIMDLAVLNKKALLIPTPGQTEQEYLAETLGEKGYFAWQPQDELKLEEGLKALEKSTGIPLDVLDHQQYERVVKDWLSTLEPA